MYDDVVDARDHALAMAAHARGDEPGRTEAEIVAYLAAGISQPYLAQLESGRRASADIAVYAKLARRQAVRSEDLMAEGE